MCGCKEVPEQHFQVEKSVLVKNPGTHFTLNISVYQDLEPRPARVSVEKLST